MPIATTDQYIAMLDTAAAAGYAYPAVNVSSSQTLNAALQGFADAGSDGIVQITVGAAEYLAGPARHAYLGAHAFARYVHTVAAASPVLIAVHTDHCPPARVDDLLRPLLETAGERVRHGEQPWFHSHMFDGSSLPLAENLRTAAELLEISAAAGLVLEVECGIVGGQEDGIVGPAGRRDELYTTPADLLEVAQALGTGERGRYLVAATFGNVHGVFPAGSVALRPEILRRGQDALAAAHPGARFQYVFHGSSGSGDHELRSAIADGVVKVNVDSDAQYAFTRGVAGHVLDHWDGVLRVDGGLGNKRVYDPRSWGARAETSMAERVRVACEQIGSARQTLACGAVLG
jgi:fructose-bisphosphate aldolase class II